MSARPFRPNIAFLEKVRDRKVYRWCAYSKRKGGHDGFVGGLISYDKHFDAGYVTIRRRPELGLRAYAELTERGRAFLAGFGIPPEPAP